MPPIHRWFLLNQPWNLLQHISSFSHFHPSHFVFILILIAAFLKVTILRISLSPSAHPASPLSRLLHQLQPSWCLDSGVCGTALYVSGCRQYSGAAMSGYVAPCRQDFCKSAPSVHCPLPQPPKCCCTPAADSSELLAKAALCLSSLAGSAIFFCFEQTLFSHQPLPQLHTLSP